MGTALGLGVGIPFSGGGGFSPLSLSPRIWWVPSDASTLFTDTAGTTAATATDAVARTDDESGNDYHGLQATVAARPTYQITPGRLQFDKVDDNIGVASLPATAGTLLMGSTQGIVHAEVNIAAGPWNVTVNPAYFPSNNITGLILCNEVLSPGAVASTKAWLAANGSGTNFAGVTSFASWIRGLTYVTTLYAGDWDVSSAINMTSFVMNCSSLTTLDVSGWDTSNVTNFGSFANGCTTLTALDVSGWNTGKVTNFAFFAFNCSSLTTLDVSGWDTSNVTNFLWFVRGCSSLTTLDVSNWNTAKVTNFSSFANFCASLTTVTVTGGTGSPFSDSPCTNYADAFLNTNLNQASIDAILVAIEAAGTSDGTFNQSGGSAPSGDGEAAIDALRGRDWTIAVTGGY